MPPQREHRPQDFANINSSDPRDKAVSSRQRCYCPILQVRQARLPVRALPSVTEPHRDLRRGCSWGGACGLGLGTERAFAYACLGLGSPERGSEMRIPVKVGRVPGWGWGQGAGVKQGQSVQPAPMDRDRMVGWCGRGWWR